MKIRPVALALVAAALSSGCSTPPPVGPGGMVAAAAKRPVVVDGILDDAVWQMAPPFALDLGEDRDPAGDNAVQAPGTAQLAWDSKYLYVGIRFTDRDVVARSDKDQDRHFLRGDVAEVFLWPAKSTWYWELYVTPRGNKSDFFFPGGGRAYMEDLDESGMDLRVAAQVQGTLNRWKDTDDGWTAEMAIPIRDLKRHGDGFGPLYDWRILVARYNYSRHLNRIGPELTMAPRLPKTSYHDRPNYALLILAP
jgi:hypothetical protein